MKKLAAISFALSVGFVAGRFSHQPVEAQAAEDCATENGDVNADGVIDLSDAISILGNLFLGDPPTLAPLCEPRGPSGLPDTGQTKCYDENGAVIDCDTDDACVSQDAVFCDGDLCAGQDGFYQTGCPSEGRFVDNEDGTVTDTCTGLMWQRDTADVNGDGQRDRHSDRLPWCDALAYCENLTFAGHDDWRLPNVRELQSIVDYGRFDSAIDPVFGAVCSGYWSSTPVRGNCGEGGPGGAWDVSFGGGGVSGEDGENRSNIHHVRAVRSGP